MRRFQFPLEKVLRLRSQQTAQARRALARAISEDQQARLLLVEARGRLAQAVLTISGQERRGRAVAEFGSGRAYLSRLGRAVEGAVVEVAAAERIVNRSRQSLLQARRTERSLERLRERRLAEHMVAIAALEQQDLDERAVRTPVKDGMTGAEI